MDPQGMKNDSNQKSPTETQSSATVPSPDNPSGQSPLSSLANPFNLAQQAAFEPVPVYSSLLADQ